MANFQKMESVYFLIEVDFTIHGDPISLFLRRLMWRISRNWRQVWREPLRLMILSQPRLFLKFFQFLPCIQMNVNKFRWSLWNRLKWLQDNIILRFTYTTHHISHTFSKFSLAVSYVLESNQSPFLYYGDAENSKVLIFVAKRSHWVMSMRWENFQNIVPCLFFLNNPSRLL